jgi:hypothetical protein
MSLMAIDAVEHIVQENRLLVTSSVTVLARSDPPHLSTSPFVPNIYPCQPSLCRCVAQGAASCVLFPKPLDIVLV